MSLLAWLLGDTYEEWLLGAKKIPDDCEISWKLSRPWSKTALKMDVALSLRARETEDEAWLRHPMSRQRKLPKDTPFAVVLFYRTGGAFHPLDMVRRHVPWVEGAINSSYEAHHLEVAGRVSVVTHIKEGDVDKVREILKGFYRMRWTEKELVIVESFSQEWSQTLAESVRRKDECIVVRVHARRACVTRWRSRSGW